jgi:hypothetical protein
MATTRQGTLRPRPKLYMHHYTNMPKPNTRQLVRHFLIGSSFLVCTIHKTLLIQFEYAEV